MLFKGVCFKSVFFKIIFSKCYFSKLYFQKDNFPRKKHLRLIQTWAWSLKGKKLTLVTKCLKGTCFKFILLNCISHLFWVLEKVPEEKFWGRFSSLEWAHRAEQLRMVIGNWCLSKADQLIIWEESSDQTAGMSNFSILLTLWPKTQKLFWSYSFDLGKAKFSHIHLYIGCICICCVCILSERYCPNSILRDVQ